MPLSLRFSLKYLTRSPQVYMTAPLGIGAITNSSEVLNGGPGVDHRIPFPIAVRSAYGYYFGSFCVVSSAIIAMTWFGVNCWVGSAAMTEVSNASPQEDTILTALRQSQPSGQNIAPSKTTSQHLLKLHHSKWSPIFYSFLSSYPFLLFPSTS